MKFLITRDVIWRLQIPFGKDSFQIGEFTLLPDFPNMPEIRHILVEVDATLKEEAESIGDNKTRNFLNKWNFLDDSKPYLLNEGSVKNLGTNVTTYSYITSAVGSIARDINDGLVNKFKTTFPPGKQIDEEPFNDYRLALISEELFEQYEKFYKVIEFYHPDTGKITKWVQLKEPNVRMIPGERKLITIYSSIRHRLFHPTKPKGQKALSGNNPQDIKLVKDNLLRLKNLAKKILEENL